MKAARSNPKFNARWYLKRYPDVVDCGMTPLDHYLMHGQAEGRLPGPDPFKVRLARLYRALVLGWKLAVRHAGGIRAVPSKAIALAQREGWFDPDFDERFYLDQYPDVRGTGISAYRHFVTYGRAEGRIGSAPRLALLDGGSPWESARETVLLVSHEASRTGAPILTLNIAQQLCKRYNVVILLLGGGPLVGAFREASAQLVGPAQLRHRRPMAQAYVDRLCDLHAFKYAIVNSIESAIVLEPLARHFVPTVSLIHEFASYTRPAQVFPDTCLWADEVVFSTALTQADALANHPELLDRPTAVVAQGRCTLPVEPMDAERERRERARVASILRPAGSPAGLMVVIGVGSVHIRKGVDLFLDCAARVIAGGGANRCRFVWIGRGYDPLRDMTYSAYLADQVRRAGLAPHFAFMDETACIEEAYRLADVLLVSSRLDPLPNVAIDAMVHGLPVVCFDQTTGIADILSGGGLGEHCVAGYLDSSQMAARVLAFADSPALREQTGQALRRLAEATFDMDRYVAEIEALALSACAKVARERVDAAEIASASLLRLDFLVPPHAPRDVSDAEPGWRYVRPWSAGMRLRKPFPGFHPGIYRELRGGAAIAGDPFAHYLRDGQPEGPWQNSVIAPTDHATELPAGLRIALHLHVYYPDLLPELLAALERNRVRPDLFVSVPDRATADAIGDGLATYSGRVAAVVTVPNRGRDIGPFLSTFGRAFIQDFDIVGHLHTKKTADVRDSQMGGEWRRFLYENLLGGQSAMADVILGQMAQDASIGLVFPDDPHVVGWGNNRPHAEALRIRLGLAALREQLAFPVGTMFWARVAALRPLLELGLDWDDYPAEPLPYDGSMLHALERLLPAVAASAGFRSVLTNVPGISR